MKSFSSIELHMAIEELSFLVGAKVDQVFQPEDNEVTFQLHITSMGKKYLRIVLPNVLYISDQKKENPETPKGFCVVLRKHLSGARIQGIKQICSERIVEIELSKKEGSYFLMVELFSKGNVVLCDSEKNIMSVWSNQTWKERTVKAKEKYHLPERLDVFSLSKEGWAKIIKDSTKESVVKILALDLGIGGMFSEEVCSNAGIEKSAKTGPAEKLYSAFWSMISQKIKAEIVYSQGAAFDVTPFPISIYGSFEKKEFSSYQEALAAFFSVGEKPKQTPHQKETLKWQRIVESQEKTIRDLQKKEQDNTQKAELIYSNYALVQEIISTINKARETHSWKEIAEKLKDHKIIKEVNAKDKSVVLELEK
jgi:predicted ribosome quality control (RQC) complex YloA/Tae2 family protein